MRLALALATAVAVLAPPVAAGSAPAAGPARLPVASIPQPVVPLDFYGTWFDAMSYDRSYNTAVFAEQHSMGIGAIRQYVWWSRIEVAPGVYDWRKLDEVVRDATDRGVAVIPTLLYTPDFYSSKPEGATGSTQYPPKDPRTMATFATAMIERYGPHGTFWCPPVLPSDAAPKLAARLDPVLPCDDTKAIRIWEVWNEPDYPAWWKGAPKAHEYAALLRTVSAAIKAADPGAEVVLGALTGARAARPGGYLESLYKLGVRKAFDTIAFTPYTVSVKDMIQRIRAVRAIATRYGDARKPFRIMEYGWATGGRSSLATVTPECQAALLYAGTKRLRQVHSELNLRGIVQFQWQDAPAKTPPSLLWPDYAGIKYPSGSPKPSRAAFGAAIARQAAPAGASLTTCPVWRRPVT